MKEYRQGVYTQTLAFIGKNPETELMTTKYLKTRNNCKFV